MNESDFGKNKLGAFQQKVPKHWKPFSFATISVNTIDWEVAIFQFCKNWIGFEWLTEFWCSGASKIKFSKNKFTRKNVLLESC